MVAVLNRTGDISKESLRKSISAINYRGKDGSNSVYTSNVGLGHQHFYTTPEEYGETQPISIDGIYITFDGRVDNREELIKSLGNQSSGKHRPLTDAEIIIKSYLNEGPEFLDDLIGSFSFALWDPSTDRFLCARDPTGIRSLYYCITDEEIIVSSDISGVLAHPNSPTKVNKGFVAEFLMDDIHSRNETFYEGIDRLDHGSYLLVEDGNRAVERYWTVDDQPNFKNKSESELVEMLRDRLQEAISSRTRCSDHPALAMSGGLDSTTIAAIMKNELDDEYSGTLQSFSYIFESSNMEALENERERIHKMGEKQGIESHISRCDYHWPLKDVEFAQDTLTDGPIVNTIQYANNHFYQSISDQGHNVVLHGGGGNIFDGNRFSYSDRLTQLQLFGFKNDILADPMLNRYLLLWYVISPLLPKVAKRAIELHWDESFDSIPNWMNDDLVEEVNLKQRLSKDHPSEKLNRQAMQFTHDLYFRPDEQFLLDSERKLALRSGIEILYPYRDARIVEFAFSLPTGCRVSGGEGKRLFKEAIGDMVPDLILDQSESAGFDFLVDKSLKNKEAKKVEKLFDGSELDKLDIISEHELNKIKQSYYTGDTPYANQLWRFICAEMWLRSNNNLIY